MFNSARKPRLIDESISEQRIPDGFRRSCSEHDNEKVVNAFKSILGGTPPKCKICSAPMDKYIVLACKKLATAGAILIEEDSDECHCLCIDCMGITKETISEKGKKAVPEIGDIIVPTKVL